MRGDVSPRHGAAAEAALQTFDEIMRTIAFAGSEPVLETVVPLVRDLLEGEQSVGYRVSAGEGSMEVDFAFGAGIGPKRRFLELGAAFFARHTGPVTTYSLPSPRPGEQNVVQILDTEEARERYRATPIVRELFPPLGLQGQDQIRVLLCDGPHLLAWLGAFRLDPFGVEEAERLRWLVQPLAQRLKLEESLRRLSLRAAALDVAMEALGAPAFILDKHGAIAHANEAGRALSSDERAEFVERGMGVSAGKLPPDPSLSLLRIEADGLPPHSLLIHKGSGHAGLAAFARRWSLTQRQSEVLQHILEGKSNKVIGSVLGIRESTVELHVTSLFRKVGVERRSELIAAYWSSGA